MADPEGTRDEVAARERLLEMSRGYVLARAIHVAAELGVADHVGAASVHVAEIARLTSAKEGHLERVLRLLAAHGIFEETAPREFAATPLSELMKTNARGSLRPGLRMVNDAWWSAVGDLEHAVTTGAPAFARRNDAPFFAYLKDHPDDQARFDAGMAANSRTSDEAIARAYDFSRAKLVVDVGGGRGGLIGAILERYAAPRGVLFDQPQVVASSPLHSAEHLAARLEIVAGDFFQRLPSGADVFVIKGVLHDFDDDKSLLILETVKRASSSGAKLLIVERYVAADNRPHQAKTIDVLMMALLGGRERSLEEWSAMLSRADLRLGRRVATESEFTILEIDL